MSTWASETVGSQGAYQSFYDMYDIIAIGGLNEMRELGGEGR